MSRIKHEGLDCVEAYGFKLHHIVATKVDLKDERDTVIPAGSKVKIVAIAPKVTYTSKWNITNFPHLYDSREYFVNLVPIGGGPRIRSHFVTIKKIKV